MKRKNLSLFFITLFISLLASCRDELSTAGGKWVESSLRTIQTDTCTVRLSTILSDSLATSGDTVCQIGTIDDPVWGKIKAAFYAEYDVPTVSFSENADYRFDSITIRFYSSGNYLGDTLSPQRISLHSLSENLSLDEGYLYTTSRCPITPLPWLPLLSPPPRAKQSGNMKSASPTNGESSGSNIFRPVHVRWSRKSTSATISKVSRLFPKKGEIVSTVSW